MVRLGAHPICLSVYTRNAEGCWHHGRSDFAAGHCWRGFGQGHIHRRGGVETRKLWPDVALDGIRIGHVLCGMVVKDLQPNWK